MAHGDQVIKCVPEHLRLASPEEQLGHHHVRRVLAKHRGTLGDARRGAFRYHDITKEEAPPTEPEEPDISEEQ